MVDIDSTFPIPKDVRDLNPVESDLARQVAVSAPAASQPPLDNSGELPIPSGEVTIISQTAKVSPGGKTTIDVVVELPDPPPGLFYQFRLAKP